jgi:hypothetical protein
VLVERVAGGLERLVHDLEHHPLLGVNGLGFLWGDVEEAGVEDAVVLVNEVCLGRIGRAMVLSVRMVECLRALVQIRKC